jgi:hypothetical protein
MNTQIQKHAVQMVLIVLALYVIFDHKRVHSNIEQTNMTSIYIRSLLLSIPILSIIYLDISQGLFSLQNMGVPKSWNKSLNKLMKTAGAYGMVQILAQDSGLKTGIIQRDTVQSVLYFAPVAIGMAFTICDNRSQAFISVLMYYHLKYAISNNKTSTVCFEDV